MPVEPFSAPDALLWRIEADPLLRSPILVFGLLDRTPEWPGVVAAFERASAAIPRLRRRVAVRAGRPVWIDDDAFAVEHHLRHVRLPDGGSVQEALDLVAADAGDAFEPSRPPWTFLLVDGLDAGGAAFALRFHHAISDGVGAVRLAEHLFDRTRAPGASEDRAAAPAVAVDGTGSAWARGAAAVRGTVRTALDPIGTARSTVRFGRSLARLLSAAPEPLSPVLRERSLHRRLRVVDVPLADLEALARRADGTVNDAFLAGVAGALHEYHDALGFTVDALRFTVPISVRRADDDEGGNHFVPVRFVLPVDDPDPVHRARLAGAAVRRWRCEPAVPAMAVLARSLEVLPTPVLVGLFGSMLRSVDVDAVDVPGLDRHAFLGGAAVERLWAFAPPAGAALSATLLSHAGTACVALACDEAAVSDPDLLARCLRRALAAHATDDHAGASP